MINPVGASPDGTLSDMSQPPRRKNQVTDDVNWLFRWRKANPTAIITRPSESRSELWEVSRPDETTVAFDSLRGMRRVLGEVE